MSGGMRGAQRPHELQRPHLEALYVAHTLLDQGQADMVEPDRVSPACNALLDLIATFPALMRADLVTVARSEGDPYILRLAMRTASLTIGELTYLSRDAVVSLCNRLPRVSRRAESAA